MFSETLWIAVIFPEKVASLLHPVLVTDDPYCALPHLTMNFPQRALTGLLLSPLMMVFRCASRSGTALERLEQMPLFVIAELALPSLLLKPDRLHH